MSPSLLRRKWRRCRWCLGLSPDVGIVPSRQSDYGILKKKKKKNGESNYLFLSVTLALPPFLITHKEEQRERRRERRRGGRQRDTHTEAEVETLGEKGKGKREERERNRRWERDKRRETDRQTDRHTDREVVWRRWLFALREGSKSPALIILRGPCHPA